MDDEDGDDVKERQHFGSVLRAYDNYRAWAMRRVDKIEADYGRLGEEQRSLLRLAEKVSAMRRAVEQNAVVIAALAEQHRGHVGADCDHVMVLVE